jgi:hypothetical protein
MRHQNRHEHNPKGVNMKKTGQLCLLLVAVVAVVAAIAAPSLASSGTTITRQSVVGSTLTCNSEVYNITAGALQIGTHGTLTPSGAYHVTVEGTAQGVKAVGPSGATYEVPGGFWIEVNLTPGATVTTETDVLNVVGQGSAPNFTVRAVVHTTVDANGNVTAVVDHLTATGDCIP